ncbi:helix-turn-helix domain-containing protein [Curtobacterium flaccumfaciens]|uniref:helix-turn-helix domain-containing protein n=1 Tax=Curtobacterium flaccumfaciens TaxID=2035 RepID=UPI00188BD51F|nr:helix-turn-helix domain-containing protein [Curtobacterium flaccumfaciens]MBF4595735.1 helix-turn-helix domain-containing protein [Curtobacterium flaccumfaciens]
MDAKARWRILRLHVEDQIPLTALARESGVPLRTLAGWLARYRKAGAAGLDTSRRSDSGQCTRLPS